MSDSPTQKEMAKQAMLPEDEQSLLDTALQESDQLLARSLHDDQRRRFRRRWLALLIGGVVMFTILLVVLFGGFALSLPDAADGKETLSSVEAVERAEALAAEGWQLWQQRKMDAAEKKFEESVKLDPKGANAWNGLGWSRFNGGDSEQALPAFEKCVALAPRHPAALNGLGQIHLMWKEYDEAEKYLLLAAPEAPAAHYGLAQLYLLQDKFTEAKPWVEKIAAQAPDDVNIQPLVKAVELGKLDDDLRRIIEPSGKPTANAADVARGWAMFQQGKMRTAERLFRRALKVDAENLSALNGLAFCLLNQGNHEQARPLFEKYLAIEKDAPGPLNGLARCLMAEGKIDEAIKIWERIEKKHPGPTAATAGLARIYLERKEYAKSIERFETLVNADSSNEEFQKGLKSAQAGLAKAK